MSEDHKNPIFCAIDRRRLEDAVELVDAVKDNVGGLKLGSEFFAQNGPQGVRRIAEFGLPIFLDLKFHDIPNTVARSVKSTFSIKPFMLNVHALGGRDMMRAAADAAREESARLNVDSPLIIAVTVLTSLTQKDMTFFGPGAAQPTHTVEDFVKKLALSAQECGLDGIVCSAHEITAAKKVCDKDFKLVVPGIRPPWVEKDDQRRTMASDLAYELGADYLVIGRPITDSKKPGETARRLWHDLRDKNDKALASA